MASKKTVGVVLSGCGYLDGSEIHEATLTLLSLSRRGARALCMAPAVRQLDVVDHLTQQAAMGGREVLVESARIARGDVVDLSSVDAGTLDAVIFPGGYGAAKNLCTFATQGKKMTVLADVDRLIRRTHEAGKPLGFLCIAPVIAAKVLGDLHPKLTIGNDPETAAVLESFGARHVDRKADEALVDAPLKIVTTPAYMCAESIAEVERGIDALVAALLAM